MGSGVALLSLAAFNSKAPGFALLSRHRSKYFRLLPDKLHLPFLCRPASRIPCVPQVCPVKRHVDLPAHERSTDRDTALA